jgi:hypothetical protein
LFAIERDARIAVLRQTHHERSETLANVPVGTSSHGRLLVECEELSDEIDRLKRCINVPRSVALTVPVLLAVLVLALVS